MRSLLLTVLLLTAGSAQAYEQCKAEGYALDEAEQFMWVLKNNAELITVEQYLSVRDVYEAIKAKYTECIESHA